MIPQLPPPTTFTEGQRALFGCLVAASGMFFGGFAAFLVSIFVWGNWPTDRNEQIIGILGWGFMIVLGIVAIVIVSLALGGPVGRLKGGLSKDGLQIEAEGDSASITVQSK